MLIFNKIVKKYPKAIEKLEEALYQDKAIQEAVQGLELSFDDKFVKAYIKVIIETDMRKVIELLDTYEIYVSCTHSKSQDTFISYVNEETSSSFDTRPEAETDAIEQGLKILNEQ